MAVAIIILFQRISRSLDFYLSFSCSYLKYTNTNKEVLFIVVLSVLCYIANKNIYFKKYPEIEMYYFKS